jgi:tetratricopeptide (TPR) repeat protein
VKFKSVWPIPALVLGGGLFVGGLVVAVMGKPKAPADVPLEQAKALVQERRYQEAIDKLNSKDVRSYVDVADAEHARAFYLARARAFAGAQQTMGLSRPENHHRIVEDYQRAEKEGKGTELAPTDMSQLVESLVALDDVDGALERVRKLPEAEQSRRARLTRAVVEHLIAAQAPGGEEAAAKRTEQTLSLLAGLSADPGLGAEDKAWVLARQGEVLIMSGQPEEAINKLIRRVGLLKDVAMERQGELYVLLGRAYFQTDQMLNAMRQLEAADGLLDRASPLRADLGVMLGRLAQSGMALDGGAGRAGVENDPGALLETARERFEGVIAEFSSGKQYARAVLGVAEVEAALKHDDKALEKYAEVVDLVKGAGEGTGAARFGAGRQGGDEKNAEAGPAAGGEHGKPAPGEGVSRSGGAGRSRSLGDVTRRVVTTSLMQRYHERFDSGQRESSLRYADVAETMYKDADVPAEILAAIGTTRRALGDQLMTQAREAHAADPVKRNEDFSVEDLDPATRAEVKKHYIIAGDYLRRHARSVAVSDPSLSSASLWTAADSFDRAGDMEEARKAFGDYADTSADTDPNKPEAKFRLAQVFQARKEYAAAAGLYRALVESRDPRDPSHNSGAVSDRSIVPLAQCMLSDNDPSNNDEAERLLLNVLEGSRLAAEAPAFHDALIELGTSYYRQDQFAKAIEKLAEALDRYKGDRQIVNIQYLLADSHRREGVKIGRELSTQKLPQAEADQLTQIRLEHLKSARSMYEVVKLALSRKEPRTLTKLDLIHLRNAYFYIADCAMEMRDYDTAIAAYDDARKQYAEEPSSLVAMAQIVVAYVAQEKWAEALTANERARMQLAKFPESVWQSPDLPMEKRHWERWLDARTLMGHQRAGEDVKGE